jgi:hypothetical protein
LETKPIQIAWEPSGIVRVRPGSQIDLKAKLYAAYCKETKEIYTKGALKKGTFKATGVPNEGI